MTTLSIETLAELMKEHQPDPAGLRPEGWFVEVKGGYSEALPWPTVVAPQALREASCRNTDPESWFPSQKPTRAEMGDSQYGKSEKTPEQAYADHVGYLQRICAGCPVLQACNAYAVANNETVGVWAGIDRGVLS